MSVAYLDTSALAKLVIAETETVALAAWLGRPGAEETVASSAVARAELSRAAGRHGPGAERGVPVVLAAVDLIAVSPDVLSAAATLGPTALRTLDAIHLATARRIGSSLSAFVAYDEQLLAAAAALGLPVVAPR